FVCLSRLFVLVVVRVCFVAFVCCGSLLWLSSFWLIVWFVCLVCVFGLLVRGVGLFGRFVLLVCFVFVCLFCLFLCFFVP
ncbi:MAG TPA: hypothetical protein VHP31_07550, partial [Caproicibacter sp.]|nr:hypothetical protein [Caproicibacter sp.]